MVVVKAHELWGRMHQCGGGSAMECVGVCVPFFYAIRYSHMVLWLLLHLKSLVEIS